MSALSSIDQLHLCEALGWLEFNNLLRATEELDRIVPSQREHPDVLNVKLMIYALLQRWEHVSGIAEDLCRRKTDFTFAWLVRAACLHQAGQTTEAIEFLSCVA
jgi:hypothetical protein